VGSIARATTPVRLGVLQFGTVQWLADVIRRHALDTAHGVALDTVILANNDAGRVSLMAGSADIVVSDWPFVATQRAAGTRLCFAPFTSATGAVMTRADAPITSLADLRGKRLGVAGGPTDKSWILTQAAGRSTAGIDLATASQVVYGAPPLLNAKLQQGELDAVLTFWNFAARLEAAGYRQVISVGDCASALGLPPTLSLVGFVFHQEWAEHNRPVIDGFLAAAAGADDLLATSDAEWQAVRPLMDAPDDALFASLRRRFVAGIAHPSKAEQEQTATKMFQIVLNTGGTRATSGLSALPPGIFWPPSDAKG
jgi:NitT/TauT family transport system substrate-binding protein